MTEVKWELINDIGKNSSSACPRITWTAAEFPLWIATESLCCRKGQGKSSPDTCLSLQPGSIKNVAVDRPKAPEISTATGWNIYEGAIPE